MKYLADGGGVVYLVTSGCFDLVGWCCRVTLLGRLVIPLTCDFCLAYSYLPNFKHQLQKILLVEKNDCLKNKPFFLSLRIFWGFWIDYARSLCAGAMIFWLLLGHHPVAVIFFNSVDVCGSVFCVF